MKRFDLPSAAINGVLCICMGLASAGSLASAFAMEASLLPALLTSLFWAILGCGVLQLRRGWIALVAALLLWWHLLWVWQTQEEFGALLQMMFDIYSRAYGITVPEALRQYAPIPVSLAISAIAGTVTLLTGFSLTTLRSGSLAITVAALPVLPCFFVTNTVPHEFFLFLLFSCIGIVLLSHGLRQRHPRQASRLTAMLLLPVMLCNLWLFQANPQQSFDKHPETVLEHIRTHWLQPLLEKLPTFTTPTFTFNPDFTIAPDFTIGPDITMPNVDLRFVGPKKEQTSVVMKVTIDHTGTLYLRGKSYGNYDGLSWGTSSVVNDSLQQHTSWTQDPLLLQIRTVKAYDLYYLAYYPTGKVALQDGKFANDSQTTEYDLFVTPLREDWQNLYLTSFPEMTAEELKWVELPDSSFTALPADTQTRAEALLREYGIHSGQHILDIADTIRRQVHESAAYDLNTPYMPAEETDFAMWFLENSDTGYCIHFATAATVLLRAAGIPARYVEGYMTQVDGRGIARVTQDQAHAWVEYWVPKVGWVIMEPTPSAGSTPPPPTTGPTEPTTFPTEPTTGPTTGPTSKPIEPSTLPTEPTTQPTAPTSKPTMPTTDATQPSTPIEPTCGDPPKEPEAPKKDLSRLWATLQSALAALLVTSAAIGQWLLRLQLRKKWLCHGSSNQQALRRWRWTRRLAKLRRQDAPAALKELAQKAKFSQHTISDEELAAFDGYFARSVDHLKTRPVYLRVVYRLIFAAY